jgi:DNA-binding MarR family transcriptional regulator/N-acetylglutamate synthase-like GNAT family acetyltransferase
MNFYQSRGELVLGSRLKRLSEKFLMEIAKIYDALDIDFEISWFPIFHLLAERRELTVTEISRELEITHSAVSQLLTVLQKHGLVELKNDADDKRKRIVFFTRDGVRLLKKVKPVWESINRIFRQRLSEGEYSAYLLQALDEVEGKIRNNDLKESVLKDIELTSSGNPDIIEYNEKYSAQYKQFLLEWIMQHDDTEMSDTDLLGNPEEILKEKKGFIRLAELNEMIVGTIVTKNNSDGTAELLFLLVDEDWQNRKIGKSLLNEMISFHKNQNITRIYASVNKSKTKAVNFLRDSGFVFGNMKTVKNKFGSDTTIILLENNLTD